MKFNPSSAAFTRRALIAVGALSSFGGAQLLFAQPRRPGDADAALLLGTIAVSRLRMLTDRVTKLVIQLQLKVAADRAQRLLDQTYTQAAEALEVTKRTANTAQLRERAGALDRAFTVFLQKARAANGINGLNALAEEADVIIEQAEQLTKQFETESKHTSSANATRAGRIRMLTQHLPVHYFLTLSGINAEPNRKEITRARGEFADLLRELDRSPGKTQQIEQNLVLVSSQWAFMDRALAATQRDEALLRDVAATSERILETIDTLTGLYEAGLKTAPAR